MSRRSSRQPRNSFHPAVDEITNETAGEIIYQEETLLIVKNVAGFGWADANDVRKIISDKLGQIVMEGFQEKFIQGCQDTSGMTPEEADRVWKAIATAGSYVFNVAHSISYAMLGYWSQFLKVHHPHEFYAASLARIDPNDGAKLGRLMRDAVQHGVPVQPPTLESKKSWSVNYDSEGKKIGVAAGWEQVRGIGEKMSDVIIQDREENGPFTSWSSLLRVKGIGPKKLEVIRGFAENDDPFGLQLVHKKLDYIRELLAAGELGPLPLPTHRSDDIPTKADQLAVVVLAVPIERNYQSYVENQRSRYGTDVEEIIAGMKRPDLDAACHLRCIDDGNEDLYIRSNRFVYPRFKKILDELVIGRDLVLAEGMKNSGFGVAIHVNRIWVIDPTDD